MLVGKLLLTWATSVFGNVAQRRDERAARLLEEAMELAQAENVPKGVVLLLVHRVYSRPPGDARLEFDQTCATLYTYAESVGDSVSAGGVREWERVQTLDPEKLRERHRVKIAQGVAGKSYQEGVGQ